MVIGEAVFQLRKIDSALAVRISESERIIRFRHILVHDYDNIHRDTVWYVIETKLPILMNEAEELLAEISSG
jgi:uncharacterized protein with HEPN domain